MSLKNTYVPPHVLAGTVASLPGSSSVQLGGTAKKRSQRLSAGSKRLSPSSADPVVKKDRIQHRHSVIDRVTGILFGKPEKSPSSTVFHYSATDSYTTTDDDELSASTDSLSSTKSLLPKITQAFEWYQSDEVHLVGQLDCESSCPFYDDLDLPPDVPPPPTPIRKTSSSLVRRVGCIRRKGHHHRHVRTQSCHDLSNVLLKGNLFRGLSSPLNVDGDYGSPDCLTGDEDGDEEEDEEDPPEIPSSPPPVRDVVSALEPCHIHPNMSQYVCG